MNPTDRHSTTPPRNAVRVPRKRRPQAYVSKIVNQAAAAGISADFIREVEGLMRPGTSALFVLDDVGDLEAVLHTLRGLGGTVVKTSVGLERARLVQSALAAPKPLPERLT